MTIAGYALTGLSPAVLGAIAAVAVLALVALHLVRTTRRRVAVSFVPLWNQAIGPLSPVRTRRRLDRALSFLLHLVMLVLLLAALGDPQPVRTDAGGRSRVLLIDRSASMSVRAGSHGPSRLEEARALARSLLADLAGEDRALVAGFARTVSPVLGFTGEARALVRAIDELAPTDERGDLKEAIAVAGALLRDRPNPEIVLVTDGGFDEGEVAMALAEGGPVRAAPVRVHLVGTPVDNLGLGAVTAQRRPHDPATVDVRARVENFGTRTAHATIELRRADDPQSLARADLILAPGELATPSLAARGSGELALDVVLVALNPEANALSSDDRAFVAVPALPRRRVLVMGPPNLYIDAALLSLGETVAAERLASVQAATGGYDAIIVDGPSAQPVPATGRFLFLNPAPAPASPFVIAPGILADPLLSDVDGRHPLLQHVSLADLNIREARRLRAAPGDEVVVSSLGTPLLLARPGRDVRAVALAFDLRRSDLPLRPGFPLLLANALDWLTGTADAGDDRGYATGESARVSLPAGAKAALVRDPAGGTTRHSASDGMLAFPLSQRGHYAIRPDGAGVDEALFVAANAVLTMESRTRLPALGALRRLVPDGNTARADLPVQSRGSVGAGKRPWRPGLATWMVVAALGLALVDWWSARRRRALGPPSGVTARAVVPLLLRITFVAAAVATIADLRVPRESRAVTLVALVDVSDSIDEDRRARHEGYLARIEAATRQAGNPNLRVVRFATRAAEWTTRTPERSDPPADPARAQIDRFATNDNATTDLGLAIDVGLGLLGEDSVGRLLLLSDGEATRGDALAAVDRARQREARIFFHLSPGRDAADVAVLPLEAPPLIAPGASFELGVRVASTAEGTARLRLLQDGRPGEPMSERTVALAAGETRVRWPTRVPSDHPTLYRVAIAHAEANDVRDNDEALLALSPAPRPQVLIVENPRGSAGPLRRALDAELMAVTTTTANAFPSPAALARFDLVVLSDLGRADLRDADARTLEAHVREGGGLLVAAGPASLASGGYDGSRLGRLLPLEPAPAAEEREATLALGLVIDRSGSMNGPKLDLTKEAARGTAEMLGPQDLITVIAFDSQPHTVVRLQAASNRQRILTSIAQLRASGGTSLLPGLRQAVEQLAVARAKKKHVIVLSDGQSAAEGIPELVDEAAAARITVSAVGVGDAADLALLQLVANRGGGRFYHTRDPQSIPHIFSRETAVWSRSTVTEETTRVHAPRPSGATAGIPFAESPALGGFVHTRARREAEVLLATTRREPILARWPLGAGQVAAWTSDVTARWSGSWSRWRYWSKLWGQVARATMRRHAPHLFPVTATLDGDRVRARIDATGADGAPLGGLEGELQVTYVPRTATALAVAAKPAPSSTAPTPVGDPNVVRVALAERHTGRYHAALEVPADAGAVLLEATLRDPRDRRPGAEARGHLSLPLSREHAGVGLPGGLAGKDLLEALASGTGGQRLGEDVGALVDPGTDRARGTFPLRLPLLCAALLVFLADVALRRATFRGPGRSVAAVTTKSSGRGAAW